MQSIDHLKNKIAIEVSELKATKGTLYFSKIDLKFAYSQLPLHPETQKFQYTRLKRHRYL